MCHKRVREGLRKISGSENITAQAATPGEPMDKLNRAPAGMTGQVILFLIKISHRLSLRERCTNLATGRGMVHIVSSNPEGSRWNMVGGTVFVFTPAQKKSVTVPETEENHD